MKQKFFSLFCIMLAMLFFCTSGWTAEERVFKVVSPWKAKGLDLDKSGFVFSRMGCLETLTTADDNGNIAGLLAESWSVSQDKLTWMFKLKSGILFHDQTPLTASAAAKCLNISLKNKGVLSRAKVQEITTAGPFTLIIKTREPFSALPAYLSHYSTGIISESSFNKNGKVKQIYGTGQYILTGYEGGTLIRFKANKNYWGEKPRIERTEYHAVPKGETRGFMMKAGQADMAFTLSPVDAKQLKSSSRAMVKILTIPRTRLMILNCNLPFFSDARVRRAISLAIDRKGIATALLRNPQSAASQLLPPAVTTWHDSTLEPLARNIDKAGKLLAQAGWKPGPDGILMKDGQRFEFDLNTYAARPMLPPIATAMQDQFKQVGIKMNILVGESSQIPDKKKDGTLQAALVARNFGLIPDAIGTIYGDYGPKPGNWGAMGWQSEKLNGLLTAYLASFDKTKAVKLRHAIMSVLQKELPVIPVTWYEHIVAVSNRIEGVHIDPFEIKSYVKGVRWRE